MATTVRSRAEQADFSRQVDELVDRYRNSCLWWMKPDYYPNSNEARRRVLTSIARHGDRAAFQAAGRLLQWLSRLSSDESAAS